MNDTLQPIESASPSGLVSAQDLDLDRFDDITTQVQSWQTGEGTRVKFVHAPGLPMLDLILSFDAGSALDDQHAGRAALTLHMLDEGVNGLDVSQFAERLEGLGAIVDKKIKLERAIVSVRTLTDKAVLEPVMALFTDLVARPDFPAGALDKIKRQLLQHDAALRNQPQVRAHFETCKHLYREHPYANSISSTPESIEALDVDALRAFHRRGYSANNLDLILVGDVSRHEAEALAQRISQALPQGWAVQEPAPLPQAASATLHFDQAAAVSSVQLTLPLWLHPASPDYHALALASEVLGSGLDSRLMTALRQQQGLTYDIRSKLTCLKGGGMFVIHWNIAATKVQASQALVCELLEHFIEQGPTHEELQLARQKLAGRLMQDVARNQGLAELLARDSHLGLPDDRLGTYLQTLAGIDTEHVRAVVQYHFDLARKLLVSVGPSADQQPLAQRDDNDQ
ncbi:pitrilysin family protein [Pseudomonas sp. EMN2]|uniref:M16 family metallopeptidase n=1 Tax=Pseudomonas sp. EMN2 TaxID=2615212 RepID=UPI00129A39A1|nr:pitrilysin family protein [Pseudomonas sp. EMN2]